MRLATNKQTLRGTIAVPGDKSISHRSIMFGALAEGETTITHFLRADDCLGTLAAFRKLGVSIDDNGQEIIVHGKGFAGLTSPKEAIDVGNSGTTIRLMMGILTGAGIPATLYGDASIAKRPMNRVMQPLRKMGATINGKDNSEFAPITIHKQTKLHAIDYEMPVASAQVKSAIILAGLNVEGETIIRELEQTRDHTEQMIRQFGGTIHSEGKIIRLMGNQLLTGQKVIVPGDISSAAFFLVAALIGKNSDIYLKNVGTNPTRTGILDVIKRMGGMVKEINTSTHQGETSADLIVKSGKLHSTEISGELIPRLIDEIPIIALLATQAEGKTIIKDAAELKVKETNRIDAVARELSKMGAKIEPTNDGLIIHGKTPLHGAKVTSYGDHRIGMMLQIAALLVEDGEVELERADAVSVSYPAFFKDLKQLFT